jgi:hypothetical protein
MGSNPLGRTIFWQFLAAPGASWQGRTKRAGNCRFREVCQALPVAASKRQLSLQARLQIFARGDARRGGAVIDLRSRGRDRRGS